MTRRLPTYRGYTVDERLREFRKVPLNGPPEFIDFDSPEGRRLLIGFNGTKTDDRDIWAGEPLDDEAA